jgi:hypothetical protein
MVQDQNYDPYNLESPNKHRNGGSYMQSSSSSDDEKHLKPLQIKASLETDTLESARNTGRSNAGKIKKKKLKAGAKKRPKSPANKPRSPKKKKKPIVFIDVDD